MLLCAILNSFVIRASDTRGVVRGVHAHVQSCSHANCPIANREALDGRGRLACQPFFLSFFKFPYCLFLLLTEAMEVLTNNRGRYNTSERGVMGNCEVLKCGVSLCMHAMFFPLKFGGRPKGSAPEV